MGLADSRITLQNNIHRAYHSATREADMQNNQAIRRTALNKKILFVHIIGAIGSILVGVAIYAIWGAGGQAFHTVLNNTDLTYSMLILGIMILTWEMTALLPLLKERSKLPPQ